MKLDRLLKIEGVGERFSSVLQDWEMVRLASVDVHGRINLGIC